jgi:3-isopropylmalate/(R)-2-methylmalate dehydratase large subunit
MGATITETILVGASGLAAVRAGDEIRVRPYFVLVYDFRGYKDSHFEQ